MAQTLLVTGGAGFIGSNFIIYWLKNHPEDSIINLDKLTYAGNLDNLKEVENNPNYTFIRGDIGNKKLVDKIMDDIDVVVHFAAETGTGQSMYEIEKYTDVNIKGTSIFLDILANEKHSVEKMIIASSRSIYGEGKYSCLKDGIVYPNERKDADMVKGDFNVKCPICNENAKLLATDEISKNHPSSIYGITKQV